MAAALEKLSQCSGTLREYHFRPEGACTHFVGIGNNSAGGEPKAQIDDAVTEI